VGPNKSEIRSGSVEKGGNAFIVEVNDFVARATNVAPASTFGKSFLNAGPLGADTIRPGDRLSLQIFENVDSPLLAGPQGVAATFPEVQVDASGYIFIPYAGRIRAAGNSPEGVRRIIAERLGQATPDPQVTVGRIAGNGASVSITGAVTAQGVYVIDRPNRTLTAMLSTAGGVAVEPEIALIKVIRGKHTGEIWFEDLFEYPEFDIALRDGDRILVEADRREFTVLGATGTQRQVPFAKQRITAIEAIAQVGGLSAVSADPTGVFVFRDESGPIASQVLGRGDIYDTQRMVYVLDLTGPNGLFLARDFSIRDGDTIYVTEAPYSQFVKIVTALTGTLGSVNALNSIATGE
jgi:polysaccharide export outer membrane protein